MLKRLGIVMTTDRLFVILLVMLIPMTGCFGAVGDADAQDETTPVEPSSTNDVEMFTVGGVFDVDSYNEKLDLGADLVQMYTGLIYEGPNQVREIIRNGK
jgi:hypothetical protein